MVFLSSPGSIATVAICLWHSGELMPGVSGVETCGQLPCSVRTPARSTLVAEEAFRSRCELQKHFSLKKGDRLMWTSYAIDPQPQDFPLEFYRTLMLRLYNSYILK